MSADDLWWQIYHASFSLEEREQPEVILESLRAGAGLVYRVRFDGVTRAIATTHLLRHPPATFLVYLAVDEKYRDRGHGGKLFDHIASRGGNLIWETQRNRIAFFERHGGVLLPRPYCQPPLRGGEPVPMQLMFRPEASAPIPDPNTVEALVRAMYFEKYGAINKIPAPALQDLLSGSVST